VVEGRAQSFLDVDAAVDGGVVGLADGGGVDLVSVSA